MPLTVPVTLKSLLTLPTETEALASVLQTYTDLRFRVTSWATVGLGNSVAKHLARTVVQLSQGIYNLASSGLLGTAEGTWLTLLANSGFDLDRTAATYTIGEIKVTVASGASPITIQPSQMIVRDPTTGYRFFSYNTSNVLIPAGSNTYVNFKAESPGDDYNVGTSNITELVSTSFLGTTVINNGQGPSAEASNEWILTTGVDEESDPALRTRCEDRWSTLTANLPSEAYRTFAIGADSNVTRASVDATNPSGAGTINVFLAGATGEVASNIVSNTDSVLQTKRALNSIVLTRSATENECVMTGTVYVEEGYSSATVQTDVESALDDYFAALDIGGTEINSTTKVWEALLEKTIQAVDGVALAQLTSGDFTMTATQVATVDYSALVFTAA